MSLSERIQEINREISATVERMLADLRQDVAQRLRTSSEEIARQVEDLPSSLPASFLAHDDIGPLAEEMARQAAAQASHEAAERASREAAGTASRGAAASVRDALAVLDRSHSQAEILAALLREAGGRFAARAAVLLVRGGEIRGWAGQGFGDGDAALRELTFSPAAGGPWAGLAQGQSAVHLSAAECADLCSRIEAPVPAEGVLIPLVLRDRVAAGLYADRPHGLPDVETLQILTVMAAQAIELLPFRERPFTPTLAVDERLAYAPPAASEAPTAHAVEAVALAEPAPTSGAALAESTAESAAVIGEVEEIEVEAEPEPVEAAPAPWETSAEALAGLPPAAEVQAEPEPAAGWTTPEPSPAATVYQPIPREAFATAPPVEGSQEAANRLTSPIEIPRERPEETVLLQRPGRREAPAESAPVPAPTPLRPVPPPAPEPPSEAPSLSGIPEVKAPSDVDGPGWAFATSRVPVSPSEDAQHEEARRLARLLVSEIKLYNEEQVEEGRRRRDVYERLKEDIDRSRQMYEERVEPRILKSTDYFYQELVRILAAGDAKALGI